MLTFVIFCLQFVYFSRNFEFYNHVLLVVQQLLGDSHRGAAWTRAFLGLPADEVHVCGSANALSLVRELAAITGDTVEVREYKRLTTLELDPEPIQNGMEGLRDGDAVIAFSRKELYQIKAKIERAQPSLTCCIVYGGLPPETRRQQASLFNDESLPTVLVASDAIGLGLNLQIGRVVFASHEKFDGVKKRPLTASEVLQIAGRAGRFGSRFNTGHVTSFRKQTHQHLKACLAESHDTIQHVNEGCARSIFALI
jgi:ATP-dependent RNA helicase SUPV3L1/SUV3